jgi:hypothetical protein
MIARCAGVEAARDAAAVGNVPTPSLEKRRGKA